MVTGISSVFGCAANIERGRKCAICGSFKINRTARGYVKCRQCGRSKSLARLRKELTIIKGFYQQVPAYRLAADLGLDIKVVTRVYQRLERSNSMRPTLAVVAKANGGG